MSGYPGQGGYPGQQPGGGYPGAGTGGYPGGQPQGYPGAPPPQGGGYPGAPPQGGGYPGGAPQQRPGGYPGAPPQGGGYPGGAPQQRPGGYPQPGAPSAPPPGGYGGSAPPPQAGGYGAPPQQQVDPNVAQWFNAVDTDRSGSITASELQRALVNGNWSHFSEEACRMMIEMFDLKRSGTIDIREFGALFNYINQWKAMFESIDRDRSGFIDQNELMQAFSQMGYRFSQTFVQNLLSKYSPRDRKLTLDNFIVACVQIKRLTDSFRTRDREMKGQATMQYEDFIGLAIGCHK